jgi:hypothetical protein
MTRNIQKDEDESDLEVVGIAFQQVQDFKYLGVNIKYMNFTHNEINLRLKAGKNVSLPCHTYLC